jgi:hypothetical protein
LDEQSWSLGSKGRRAEKDGIFLRKLNITAIYWFIDLLNEQKSNATGESEKGSKIGFGGKRIKRAGFFIQKLLFHTLFGP